MITIIHQGFFTTIQDKGRWGYQSHGMPVAGAMDQYAYRAANLLAGNEGNAAVIEMTMLGASFRFDNEQFVALCGADMQGTLNGAPIPNWSSFVVPRGAELKFGSAKDGCRTYLAIRGGLDVPVVLESRSTYTRGKIGGWEGRTLRQGDVLYIGQERSRTVQPQCLETRYIPRYSDEFNLRVILGPQDHLFSEEAIKTFFKSTYIITEQADRVSYRLKGPKIMPIKKTHIVSDALCLGAIQIPAHGMPVIMMADHQTTDGFPKLGAVVRADLAKLAQARPGNTISFTCAMEEEAIEALRNERQRYIDIGLSLK